MSTTNSQPTTAGLTGMADNVPGVRFVDIDPQTGFAAAAIADREPSPSPNWQRDIYPRLPHDARQQMLLSRRWGVWAVLATDAWARAHANQTEAP